MEKQCTKCGIKKSLECFYKNIVTKDRRSSWCRVCTRAHINAKRRSPQVKKARFVKRIMGAQKYGKECKKRYWLGPASYDTFASKIDFAENIFKGNNGEILAQCTYCNKQFTPTLGSVHCRIQSLECKKAGECRLYCSEACRQACPSYHRKDFWKSQKPATSREVSAHFRQLVLKRDNWICQKCGAGIEAELHVHHIEGAVQQLGMANDLENGITLCRACHKHVHSQEGCKYHELRCPKLENS